VLAIAALAPGICSFIGVLIAATAIQMMIGRAAAYFPAVIGRRPLPARHLRRIVPHAIAALRCIERHIHPRWSALVAAAKPLIGFIVIALSGLLIFLPLPLSNIGLALSIAAISLAYLESDGLLLMLSLLAGLAFIIFNSALVWAIVWNLL